MIGILECLARACAALRICTNRLRLASRCPGALAARGTSSMRFTDLLVVILCALVVKFGGSGLEAGSNSMASGEQGAGRRSGAKRHRVKYDKPVLPEDDCGSLKGANGQYTMFARLQLAQIVLAPLTSAERVGLGRKKGFPQDSERMTPAYDQLVVFYEEHERQVKQTHEAAMQQMDVNSSESAGSGGGRDPSGGDSPAPGGDYSGSAASSTASGGQASADSGGWRERVQWEGVAAEEDVVDAVLDEEESASSGSAPAAAASARSPPAKRGRPTFTPQQKELREQLKEIAKKYAKRLMRMAAVGNIVANQRGWKLQRNEAELILIKDMLVRGWKDTAKQRRLFRNVDELEAYDAARRLEGHHDPPPPNQPSFAEVKATMKVKSNRTIWVQLKLKFGLKKMRYAMRRKRNAPAVMVRTAVAVLSNAGQHEL